MDISLAAAAWDGIEQNVQALVDAWLVKEGDRVEVGQAVARVVLVEITLEVPSPETGILERILVPAGQTFPVGRPLATLRPV